MLGHPSTPRKRQDIILSSNVSWVLTPSEHINSDDSLFHVRPLCCRKCFHPHLTQSLTVSDLYTCLAFYTWYHTWIYCNDVSPSNPWESWKLWSYQLNLLPPSVYRPLSFSLPAYDLPADHLFSTVTATHVPLKNAAQACMQWPKLGLAIASYRWTIPPASYSIPQTATWRAHLFFGSQPWTVQLTFCP